MHYAIAREHSSRVGRFYMPDPVRGRVSNPQRLNRYAYTRNDPSNRIDPKCLADESPWGDEYMLYDGPTALDVIGEYLSSGTPCTGIGCRNGGGDSPDNPYGGWGDLGTLLIPDGGSCSPIITYDDVRIDCKGSGEGSLSISFGGEPVSSGRVTDMQVSATPSGPVEVRLQTQFYGDPRYWLASVRLDYNRSRSGSISWTFTYRCNNETKSYTTRGAEDSLVSCK